MTELEKAHARIEELETQEVELCTLYGIAQAENGKLRADLEAIGAGGVYGPLMTPLPVPQPALSALWMPIETAPKYTEHGAYYHLLLGYAPDEIHEDGFVSQGYWMEAEEDAPDNMGHDGGWVDVHFDFFSCGRSFGAEAYRSAGTQPTHWQPLPPSPSMDGESNG